MGPTTYIDLFAGAGGFSLGLDAAGFTGIAHVEIDEWACRTLRRNFSAPAVVQADVSKITDREIRSFPRPDVMVAGPPCQGFSVAGPSQFNTYDPRNALVLEVLRWTRLLKPRVTIIENVPTMLSKRDPSGSSFSDVVQAELDSLGYDAFVEVLDAARYGVPQFRRRAFIVGVEKGLGWKHPEPSHGDAHPGSLDLFGATLPYVTVRDAISDLPLLDAGEGTEAPQPYPEPSKSEYQRSLRKASLGVANHVAMRHTTRLIERFKSIRAGQSLVDVAASHPQLRYRNGQPNKTPYKTNNQRLAWDEPSIAIPASFQSTLLHPARHRNLTAREAARLMSFPDDFIFEGQRTAMSWERHLSQYNQIGNAVCPLVAEAVGFSVLAVLKGIVREKPRVGVRPRVSRSAPLQAVPMTNAVAARKVQGDPVHEIRAALRSLSEGVVDAAVHRSGVTPGYSSEVLAAALALAATDECVLCDASRAPFGRHNGFMPFLISKVSLESLAWKHKDHGLDYHLRKVFRFESETAHFVAENLEQLGLAEMVTLENDRTGRRVRGFHPLFEPALLRPHAEALFGVIARHGLQWGSGSDVSPARETTTPR